MGRVLTCLFATHANILTSERSAGPHGSGFTAFGTLPYPVLIPENEYSRTFGTLLSPDTFSAQPNLTSELLRFL